MWHCNLIDFFMNVNELFTFFVMHDKAYTSNVFYSQNREPQKLKTDSHIKKSCKIFKEKSCKIFMD